MQAPVVIIGSGLAGFTVARELRKLDGDMPLTLITRDAGDFYSKPMLSTALALKKTAANLVTTPGRDMASQLSMELMPHTQVQAIDTNRRSLLTNKGEVMYQSLILALGADPINLNLSGSASQRVVSVNDLSDYAEFRKQIEGRRRIAILGAGLIGCEFANDLLTAGYSVDVIDLAAQPLGRLLPQKAAQFMKEKLEHSGVRWHLSRSVASVDLAGEDELLLTLSDLSQIRVDAVLSAVGLRPRTELAQSAGIQVHRGVKVDRHLQTSSANVYALGDCAEVEGLVLPYVMPIMHSARVIAARLAGQDAALSYPAMPVVVKTSLAPCVVSPPAASAKGVWVEFTEDTGVQARFEGDDGRLLGFALTGSATAQKAQLTKLLPPVL